MRKKFLRFFLVSATALSASLYAHKEDPKKIEKQTQETEVFKLSEAFGHLLGKNLGEMGITLDIESVIKGLRDASLGENPPMSETECMDAITVAQKKAYNELAEKNLKQADNFLQENSKNKGVTVLEKGKVQYKILSTGEGTCVEPHSSPLVRYMGKYLNGEVFGSSKEDEILLLDEIIPGLKSALLGMKEGEKRVVYIHPDLAYGTHGYLAPNSLLTFELEIVKANIPEGQKDALIKQTPLEEPQTLLEEEKNLR